MPVGEIIGSKLIKNIHTITSRLFHMKQLGCYYQPMLPLSEKRCSTNTSILCLISVDVNTANHSFIDIYATCIFLLDWFLSKSKNWFDFFSKGTICNYLLHYFAYSLLRHLIVKKRDFSISSTHILQLFSNHNSIVVQLYILMSYVFTVHAVQL